MLKQAPETGPLNGNVPYQKHGLRRGILRRFCEMKQACCKGTISDVYCILNNIVRCSLQIFFYIHLYFLLSLIFIDTLLCGKQMNLHRLLWCIHGSHNMGVTGELCKTIHASISTRNNHRESWKHKMINFGNNNKELTTYISVYRTGFGWGAMYSPLLDEVRCSLRCQLSHWKDKLLNLRK